MQRDEADIISISNIVDLVPGKDWARLERNVLR